MKPKVAILDAISQTGVDILNESCEAVILTGKTEDEIVSFIADYQGIVVRSATTITPRILDVAKSLKIIGRAGVGVDNIHVATATERGVIVVNSPEGNTIAAAEQAVALMFAAARSIPQAAAKLQNGVWDRKTYVGVELYGKTLGVVGLGKIGSHVAKSAVGLGMQVVAYDPVVSIERAQELGATLVSLDELAAQADFISLHTPLNDHTKGLVNAGFLAKCKKSMRLINCARGGVIVDEDLAEAVKNKVIAGAALDVFSKEPLPEDSPLRGIDNIILTPHLGASTVEAQENVALDVCKQMAAYLGLNEPVSTAVNMPALTGEVLRKLQPYLGLGKGLGALFHQVFELFFADRPRHGITFTLTHKGPLSSKEMDLVGRSVIMGQYGDLHDDLNLVNAPLVMERQGMKMSYETTTNEKVWPDSLSLSATIDGEAFCVAGHVDLDGALRIHQVGPYTVDFHPEGRFLMTRHTDQPGMIGRVGTLLGEHNVNIAGMMVGRKGVRGEAIMLLQLDDDVQDSLLVGLKEIPGFGQVQKLNFPS